MKVVRTTLMVVILAVTPVWADDVDEAADGFISAGQDAVRGPQEGHAAGSASKWAVDTMADSVREDANLPDYDSNRNDSGSNRAD